MKDLARKRVNKRVLLFSFLFFLWTAGLAFRLVQLQVLRHSDLKAEVVEQSRNIRDILPRRGTIYDRNAEILAQSLPSQSLFLSPSGDDSPASVLERVSAVRNILNMTNKDFQAVARRVRNREHFIYLKRKVDEETARRVLDLGLPGVFAHEESKRIYPNGRLAAHVLGGVSIDETGLAGIEVSFNSLLQGEKGQALILRDARRRKYHLETLKNAESGKDLFLTLDETLQFITETALEKAVLLTGADWGTAVLAHPPSGEVLALANFPSYNPNSFPGARKDALVNRAIQHNFEPGSTFKLVTAAAALESGLVGLSEIFDCRESAITVPGAPIRDHKTFGLLTFPQVLIHSSNIGAIQIGQRIGQDQLDEMVKAFGFGHKTDIGLPGEEAGITRSLKNWGSRTLPSISIGYEISVTALQMLQAANIIANRGEAVPLSIVLGGSEHADHGRGEFRKRVISETTADRLTAILEEAVTEGTGTEATIEGYRVAGKTGTAQIYDRESRAYSSSRHLASFVGFVPSENPVLSAVIVLHEPKGSLQYGGQVAAPVFREIAGQSLRYLHVPPVRQVLQRVIAAQFQPEVRR